MRGYFASVFGEELEMAKAPKDPNAPATPRKPRGAGKGTLDQVEIVSALTNHLRFVAIAHEDNGQPYAAHCMLHGKWLVAFNGVLAAGVQIEEDISACPNTLILRKAIARAGSKYAMTIDGNKLTVKAGKFRMNVPTLDPSLMQPVTPDQCQWPLDDKFRDALKAASAFASDNAQTVVMASLRLTNGTVAGTDRNVILEFYHGNQMPEVTVPKEFATAIIKTDKPIVGFGYREGVSITVWFSDWSFIRTQLYAEGWPDSWRNALPQELPNARELPPAFWEAYDAIADFCEDEVIRFDGNNAHSHPSMKDGATYETPELGINWQLNVRRLKMIRPYVKTIGPINDGVLGFFGDNVRGSIALFKPRETDDAPKPAAPLPAPQPAAFAPPSPAAVQQAATAAGAAYTPPAEGFAPVAQTEEPAEQSNSDFVMGFQPGIADAYAETTATAGSDGWGSR